MFRGIINKTGLVGIRHTGKDDRPLPHRSNAEILSLQNKLDTSLEMLRDGMRYDVIVKYTKLSVEDIEKLAQEYRLV